MSKLYFKCIFSGWKNKIVGERFSGCGSKTMRIVEAFAEHDSRLMGLLERLA